MANGFKRSLTAIIALTLIVALAACGGKKESGGTDASNAQKQETKKATIGYLAVMDDAQAILADKAGLYKAHGLDVEMKVFNSGTDLIKAIAGGQIDAGVLGFTNALSWASKGADLKVVGGAQLGYHSLLVKNASGIKTVADLRGKKLASQKQGSTADTVLNGVTLAKANLTSKDIDMKYLEPQNAIQALAAGTVDAAFVFEPYDTIALKQQSDISRVYEIGKEWPFPCMVVITSGDVLKKDRDKVNRMLDAQKEAIDMLKNDPNKAAGFIAPAFIGGDMLKTPSGDVSAKEVIAESIKTQTFTYEITPDDVKRMQEISDIMLSQKQLDKAMTVDTVLDLTWQQSVKK